MTVSLLAMSAPIVGCSEGSLTIPLPGDAGDQVAVVFWQQGEPQISLRALTPGRPLAINADRDRRVYTFILNSDAFIDPAGRPIAADQLAKATLRTDRDPAGDDECGRCLIQTTEAPQPMPPGTACTVPAFAAGAAWASSSGDTPTCLGDASGRVCAPSSAEDQDAIEEIRRQLVLVWPGTCACRLPDAPPLDGMTFEALTPIDEPWPVTKWTRSADGRIAGFGRDFAVTRDPLGGAVRRTRLIDLPLTTIEAAIAQRDDDAFLITGPVFNGGRGPPYAFYRFRPEPDGLGPPEPIDTDVPARPISMGYLEDGGPLYLIGSVQRVTEEPAIYACTDRDLTCTQAPIDNCPLTQVDVIPEEARLLNSGVAVARADRALYWRAAFAGASGVWTCTQPATPRWLNEPRAEAVPNLSTVGTLGVSGDRAFACGLSEVRACEEARPMVITATITSETQRPDWRLAYLGAPGVHCASIIERTQIAEGVRVVLSDQSYVDFDRSGAVVDQGAIDEAYGPFAGRQEILDLGDDVTLHLAPGNRAAFAEPNRSSTRFYGPPEAPTSTFNAGVALGDGRFIAFGAQALTIVEPNNEIRRRPATDLDFTVTAAALDPASPLTGPWRAVVGSDDGRLAVVTLTDSEVRVALLESPVPDRQPIRGIAALHDGLFVTAGPNDRVLRIEGTTVTTLPIQWDDPDTASVERAPRADLECAAPGTSPDPFVALSGGTGAAWAVGNDGLVLRILPDRAERFGVGEDTDLSAVDAACPDVPRFGGRRLTGDFGSTSVLRLAALAAEPAWMSGRGLMVQPIGEDEVVAITAFSVRRGRPVGLLRDGAWTSPSRTGFAFVIANGYLHRMFSGEAPELWRVPFQPTLVAPAADGSALFGTSGGLLAVGRPSGP